MDSDRFDEVDEHLEEVFGGTDPAFARILQVSEGAGLPEIEVSPHTGRFLQVLVAATGARRVLELGTLGGYSTLWLARGLPGGGRVISLEYSPHHADVARGNLEAAGVGDRVEVRVGAALDLLAELAREHVEPFDLVFIDADKPPYADYLDAAIELSRPGTLIVADNVVRDGAIADGASEDPAVTGVQRFNRALATHPRLEAAAVLQLVGSKGHDGLGFAVVRRADPGTA